MNRTDSLNLAFIRGALAGYACASALEVALSLAFTWYDLSSRQSGFSVAPLGYWFSLAMDLLRLLPSAGLLLGGYIGRARR